MSFHGRFCWYELMTSDPDGAAAFYREALGWKAIDSGMPGGDYRLFQVGEQNVGGLMGQIPNGPAPSWLAYVAVEDIGATVAAAKAGGANVHREPTEIPGIGHFAIFADPQGALLAILQPLLQAPGSPTPPCAGWHELHTTDQPAACDFHGRLFGWSRSRGIEMGPMGIYQIIARGSEDIGAVFNASDASPPYWMFYFTVPALDTAATKVTRAGGAIMHGPMEVPGGNWVVNARDPQGARFSLVAPGR